MVECKCVKNLVGFATSRPPFVIFTSCLAIFAAGLFSVGYYVQSYDFEGAKISQWTVLIRHVSSKEFCMFGNVTQAMNNTNDTNKPMTSTLNLVQVNLPVLIRFSPNNLFFGAVKNISHVTTLIHGSELGLSGDMYTQLVNLTFSLDKPWSESCSSKKCYDSVLSTCVTALLPKGMIPNDMSEKVIQISNLFQFSKIGPKCPHDYCNATQVHNMASMVSFNHCGKQCCMEGITVRASFPRYFQQLPLDSQSEMGLNDWATVNLRLQYSSYFLFVMAITCILYGMIKGRPMKSISKKGSGQTI